MADKSGKTAKKTLGSSRARANLPAKAGRRRPQSIYAETDKFGNRNYVAAPYPLRNGDPHPCAKQMTRKGLKPVIIHKRALDLPVERFSMHGE